MAPVAPSKRRSLRAKLAAKTGAEPHAPRKAPRPDAVAPSFDGFTSSKKDKRIIKRSALISRIEKTHRKPLKRRRPGKKLVANLESLADALPDLLADGETSEGLRQLREGKIRHKSLKMRKGALKKKEKIVKGEMDRFTYSLARLNTMGAANVDSNMQIEGQAVAEVKQAPSQSQAPPSGSTTSTAGRWAALRGFISSTMEQNPAFVGKQDGQ
ncbi:ribosome biogenesis protein SLX9-domain-containing protein [Xylaria bambusicola]|uniref:ribosome biogenesis protein SLX9-domain-containing protein n=1 Tax=Xylaria bambusicola TaxID=326684 RepID=UPI00200807D5|nr:ribosome biogenesis protein SLX9-domain-containing protein [Xylaria bambusicola]KAI0508414.1 ribosome biogenesis protein SLX9-domain-containing protein [Xylaria bambusicola]